MQNGGHLLLKILGHVLRAQRAVSVLSRAEYRLMVVPCCVGRSGPTRAGFGFVSSRFCLGFCRVLNVVVGVFHVSRTLGVFCRFVQLSLCLASCCNGNTYFGACLAKWLDRVG